MTTASTLNPGHIGLNVSNLDRSVQFYQAALGFDVLRRSEAAGRLFAFLGSNGSVVLTLWQQSDGAFAADRPGLHHLAFRAESAEQVAEAEARLRELGATIHHGGRVRHAEGASSGGVFFEDPDGIRLEIFAGAGMDDASAPYGAAPTCGFF
jgi:lactoylglutathione lyase